MPYEQSLISLFWGRSAEGEKERRRGQRVERRRRKQKAERRKEAERRREKQEAERRKRENVISLQDDKEV